MIKYDNQIEAFPESIQLVCDSLLNARIPVRLTQAFLFALHKLVFRILQVDHYHITFDNEVSNEQAQKSL